MCIIKTLVSLQTYLFDQLIKLCFHFQTVLGELKLYVYVYMLQNFWLQFRIFCNVQLQHILHILSVFIKMDCIITYKVCTTNLTKC